MDNYKETIERVNSLQLTEKGAVGYSTSGKDLVDLNFSVPSGHGCVDKGSIEKFIRSLNFDTVTTIKWLFYLRDIREGLGERKSFVNLYMVLYSYNKETALKLLPLIPEFGRWKDMIDILSYVDDDSDIANEIYNIIEKQFKEDCLNGKEGKSVSLLGKWLPSINASKKSRHFAKRIVKKFGIDYALYRKSLSMLRKQADVTEIKTCGNQWGEIDYNRVSSNANARYLNAFMRHDQVRRTEYLNSLADNKSGAVMHASNLYPYEVYEKYSKSAGHYYDHYYDVVEDKGIEELWKNLKSIETTGNTMVVVDGSGSMESHVRGTNVMAIDVARSLGAFFSERCVGEFKDKVIEFSAYPKYIDLSGCKSLAEKHNVLNKYDDCSTTNIEKVFDLLLMTATSHKIPQNEMPERILIISDMEFDGATAFYGAHTDVMSRYQTLFEKLGEKWANAGYKMPRLVFWNVNSRTNTIPLTENEAGVALVSGFSVNNVKMVLSGETDPWLVLKSVLDAKRYDIIEETLKK